MRIGMFLGPELTAGDPRGIGDLARHAEGNGIDALFVGDHLVVPRPFVDSTVVLATVAAATSTLRIGFGVLLPALRPVAWAAKQLAALQLTSGDRVILGVGSGGPHYGTAGWDAAGVPFDERGPRTDTALALLPRLVAGEPTALGGSEIALRPGATMPPVWVGGTAGPALRRCLTYARTWFPSMLPPDRVVATRRRLSQLADAAGRPLPGLAVGAPVRVETNATADTATAMARTVASRYGIAERDAADVPIAGSPARVSERMAAWAELGAEWLVLSASGDWREQVELVAAARPDV